MALVAMTQAACTVTTRHTSADPTDDAAPGADATPGADGSLGVGASSDTILLHQEYAIGVGGYGYFVYNPYLFRQNGDLYSNLATSPDNVDAAKTGSPKDWGRWTLSGDTYSITWNSGKTSTWAKASWVTTRAATAGAQIEGSYYTISGGGSAAYGGDFVSISAANVSFRGAEFTFASTGGGSSGGVSAYASDTEAGHYTLDGNTIELRFNNGTVSRKYFYFYPDSETEFGIGSRTYVPNQ